MQNSDFQIVLAYFEIGYYKYANSCNVGGSTMFVGRGDFTLTGRK